MEPGRIALYRRDGTPIGDLTDVIDFEMVEEVNGDHSLKIVTPTHLEVGTYALIEGPDGRLREYCVNEPDERHERGDSATGTYVLPWSLYTDLMGADGSELWASAESGTLDPIPARRALEIALSDQTRWTVGTVDVDTIGAVSLYDDQVWNYLSKLVEVFGGEVDAEIVADDTGVIARRVALRRHIGSDEVTRRFDWSLDLTSIRRTPAEGPYFCGVRPRGGHAKTDADGVDYTERIGIEDEPAQTSPDGWYHPARSPYLIDPDAEMAFRVSDGQGGYEYPMRVVTYDVAQTSSGPDAEELLTKAAAEIHDYTRPKVTYEASVLALAEAGMVTDGISLGDEVHCVDRGFNADAPLRIEGRVMRIECDPRSWRTTMQLTIGSLAPTMAQTIRGLAKGTLATVERRIATVEGEAARFRNIDVDTLVADMGMIETLYVTGLDVDEAIIGKLSSNYAHVTDGVIDNASIRHADVDGLYANYAHVTEGTIDNATIGYANVVGLDAHYAQIDTLEAGYAKIDASNITELTARDAWVSKLLVQSGLIAHEGTVYTLDAIKVNAANITTGTLDVERLVVTVGAQKYLLRIDPDTGRPAYEKLDGNVIGDRTIAADKLIAHSVTAQQLTVENIEGTGGWINLHTGTFAYTNAETGEGIVWDGQHLYISGEVSIGTGEGINLRALAEMARKANQDAATALEQAQQAQQAASTASDLALLVITSTHGQLFKNGAEQTILQCAVFPAGGGRLDSIEQVRETFGAGAYIRWRWMHESTGEWGTLVSTDPHIMAGGMWLNVTPDDVDTKTTFEASLIVAEYMDYPVATANGSQIVTDEGDRVLMRISFKR